MEYYVLENCFSIHKSEVLEKYFEDQISQHDDEIEVLNKLERQIWDYVNRNNLQTDICNNIDWIPCLQIYLMAPVLDLASKTEVLGMLLRYIWIKRDN